MITKDNQRLTNELYVNGAILNDSSKHERLLLFVAFVSIDVDVVIHDEAS